MSSTAYSEEVAARPGSPSKGMAAIQSMSADKAGQSPGQIPDERFAETKRHLIALIAEATKLPPDFFELSFDPHNPPSTLAAIVTQEAKKDRWSEGKELAKPRFIISAVLLDKIAKTDDQLKWILRHEFFHNVSSGKLQKYLDEKKGQGEYFRRHTGDTRKDRQVVEFLGSKGLEFYSDLMAQKEGLANGEDPEAPLQAMRNLQAWIEEEGGKSWERRQTVSEYLHSSHPDSPERTDALRGHREFLKGDRNAYPHSNRNVVSGSEKVMAIQASLRTPQYHADGIKTVWDALKQLEWDLDKKTEKLDMENISSLGDPEVKHRRLYGIPLADDGQALFDKQVALILKQYYHAVLDKVAPHLRKRDTKQQIKILVHLQGGSMKAAASRDPSLRERLDKMQAILIHDLHRQTIEFLKKDYESEKAHSFFSTAMRGVPPEMSRQWVLRFPYIVEHQPKEAAQALRLLNANYGESHSSAPILKLITVDDWLDISERIVRARPDSVIDHLDEFRAGVEHFRLKGELDGKRAERLAKVITDGLDNSKELPRRPFSWLILAREMQLPMERFAPLVKRSLEQNFKKSDLPQLAGAGDLFSLYDEFPEFRKLVLEKLQDLADFAVAEQTDPKAYRAKLEADWRQSTAAQSAADNFKEYERYRHKDPGSFEERLKKELHDRMSDSVNQDLMALKRLVVRLHAHPQLRKEIKNLDAAYLPLRASFKKASEAALSLPEEELKNRLRESLANLESYFWYSDDSRSGAGLMETLRRESGERLVGTDISGRELESTDQANAMLLSLLDRSFHPELRNRLGKHRDEFILEFVDLNSSGRTARLSEFFGRVLPVQERADFFSKLVAERGLDWPYEQFAKKLPFAMTVSFIADLKLSADDKSKLLTEFTTPVSAEDIQTILTKVYPDLQKEWLQRPLYAQTKEAKLTNVPDYSRDFMKFREDSIKIFHLVNGISIPGAGLLFSQSFDRAVGEWLSALRRSVPAFQRAKTIEEMVLAPFSQRDMSGDNFPAPARARLERELFDLVPPERILDRARIFRTARERDIPSLSTPEQLQSLFENIKKSPLSAERRIEALEKVNGFFSPRQLQALWEDLAGNLFEKAYDAEKAARLLNGVYGNYEDGRIRKMNEIFNHFELTEAQMGDLRKRVFDEEDMGRSYKIAEIIRGGIKENLSDPKASLDFITWLQGDVDSAPAMARGVLNSIEKFIDGSISEVRARMQQNRWNAADDALLKFYQHAREQFSETRLKDIYQSNRIEMRMLILSDLLSPSRPQGMLASENGRELFLEFVTSGVEKKNLKLAKSLLRAQFRALGEEGHALALQMIGSMGGNSDGKHSSDAEKLKMLLEKKGALWIKLGQQLYGDPYLLPDPAIREVFKSLTDNAAPPDRQELYNMLKKALGNEYGKIKSIRRIMGSGSINVTVLVEFEDGTRSVARMVKGNPENFTEFEMEGLRKMMALLREEAKAGSAEDPAHAATLNKIVFAMEEYLEGTAAKIHQEVDLKREAKLADLVRDSYTRNFDDLSLSVRLVEPEEKVVKFYRPDEDASEGKLADPERIVLYPEIKDISHTLSAAERRRVQTAIVRAEWEALFSQRKFDPDGHRGNWLVTRDPQNPKKLILHRIDYSQAEAIPEIQIQSLKNVVEHLFNQGYRWMSTGLNLSDEELLRTYRNLVVTDVSPQAFETAFFKALNRVRQSGETNPVAALALLQASLKTELDGQIKLHPSVRTALKSVMTTYGALDKSNPREDGKLTEEFLRIVIGKSPSASRWSGIAATALGYVQRWIPEKKAPTEQLERHDYFKDMLGEVGEKPLAADTGKFFMENYEKRPEYRQAVFKRLQAECVSHGCSNRVIDFLRSKAHENGYKNGDEWLRRALVEGPFSEAARVILFEKKVHLYPALVESYVHGGRLKSFPISTMGRDFREYADKAMADLAQKKPGSVKVSHLLALPKTQFPQVHALAQTILKQQLVSEEQDLAFQKAHLFGLDKSATRDLIDKALDQVLPSFDEWARTGDRNREPAESTLYWILSGKDYHEGPRPHHDALSFEQYVRGIELLIKIRDRKHELFPKNGEVSYHVNFGEARFTDAQLASLMGRYPEQVTRDISTALLERAKDASTGAAKRAALKAHNEALGNLPADLAQSLLDAAHKIADFDPRKRELGGSSEARRRFVDLGEGRLLEIRGESYAKNYVWRLDDGMWLKESAFDYNSAGLSGLLGWDTSKVDLSKVPAVFRAVQSRKALIDLALHPQKYGLPETTVPDLDGSLLGKWTEEDVRSFRHALPILRGRIERDRDKRDVISDKWERALVKAVMDGRYEPDAAQELAHTLSVIREVPSYELEKARRILAQRHFIPEQAKKLIAYLEKYPIIDPQGEPGLSKILLGKADLIYLMQLGLLSNPSQRDHYDNTEIKTLEASELGFLRSLRFDSPTTEAFFREYLAQNLDPQTWENYRKKSPYQSYELAGLKVLSSPATEAVTGEGRAHGWSYLSEECRAAMGLLAGRRTFELKLSVPVTRNARRVP